MLVAEVIGLALIIYGVWFGARGLGMWFDGDKEWWRPTSRKSRYPYPAAGVLLGVFFVLLGGRFALHYLWEYAPLLGYIGGVLFLVVVLAGVAQPRFLHPKWYGRLEDALGKEGVRDLRAEALRMEAEEWHETAATQETFEAWVRRTALQKVRVSRGYRRGG